MLSLLALASALPAEPPRVSVVPTQQARASVRIVAAKPIHFAEVERTSPEKLRTTQRRHADGTIETVRLLEFE